MQKFHQECPCSNGPTPNLRYRKIGLFLPSLKSYTRHELVYFLQGYSRSILSSGAEFQSEDRRRRWYSLDFVPMEAIAFAAIFISLPVVLIAVVWGFYFYWGSPARKLKDQARSSQP